jgi:hypothetical protein
MQIPAGPNQEQIFTAVVMAVCGLLIDGGIISLEQLETRAQDMLENPELFKAADVVQAVAQRLAAKAVAEYREREAKARAEQANLPPVPRRVWT